MALFLLLLWAGIGDSLSFPFLHLRLGGASVLPSDELKNELKTEPRCRVGSTSPEVLES